VAEKRDYIKNAGNDDEDDERKVTTSDGIAVRRRTSILVSKLPENERSNEMQQRYAGSVRSN